MLAFVHIHKTAGTTLNWNLRRSFGVHHCDVEPWDPAADYFSARDYRRLTRLAPRIDSLAGHKVRAYSDLDDAVPGVRYYTFLREPVARIASLYQHGVLLGGLQESLEEWLHGRRNGQTVRIAGTDDVDAAIRMLESRFIFVGDVKRFEESLVILGARAGDPRLSMIRQSRNVASDDAQKKAILGNPRLVAMIKETTINDQRLYDYVTQELYPRQQREYGATLAQDVAAFRATEGSGSVNARLLSNFAYRRLFYRPLLGAYRLTHRASPGPTT